MSEIQQKCFSVMGSRNLNIHQKIALLTELMHQAQDFQRTSAQSTIHSKDCIENDLRLLELSLQKLKENENTQH